jgi:hypothetical protein
VPADDVDVEVLDQPDALRAAGPGRRAVPGQLDEVEPVVDRQRARELREEDEARLERADEDGLQALVVARDLPPELVDARAELVGAEVDLPDSLVWMQQRQDASSRP